MGKSLVGSHRLGELIKNLSMTIDGFMINRLISNFANPNIVLVFEGLENVHCCIRLAKHGYYSSVCPISNIDCSILSWLTRFQWLCSLK